MKINTYMVVGVMHTRRPFVYGCYQDEEQANNWRDKQNDIAKMCGSGFTYVTIHVVKEAL